MEATPVVYTEEGRIINIRDLCETDKVYTVAGLPMSLESVMHFTSGVRFRRVDGFVGSCGYLDWMGREDTMTVL